MSGFKGLFCETKPGHYRTVVGNIQVIELFCQTAVPQGFQTTPDENIVQPHVFSQAAVIVVRPFGSVTNRCDGTRMGQVFGVGRIEQDPDRSATTCAMTGDEGSALKSPGTITGRSPARAPSLSKISLALSLRAT